MCCFNILPLAAPDRDDWLCIILRCCPNNHTVVSPLISLISLSGAANILVKILSHCNSLHSRLVHMFQYLLEGSFIFIKNVYDACVTATNHHVSLFAKHYLFWKCFDWVGIVALDAHYIIQSMQAKSICHIVH